MLVPRRRVGRIMGAGRGEVQEQRSLRVPNERRGVPGQHVRRVVVRIVSVGPDPSIDREVVVVVLAVLLGQRHPPVPAVRDVVVVSVPPVLVQVLADERGLIPAGLEPGGDGGPVVERVKAAIRRGVRVDARGVRVLAGQDGGPAGAAQRVRHERIGERDAVGSQPRLDLRHRPQRVPPLVVGQYPANPRKPRSIASRLERSGYGEGRSRALSHRVSSVRDRTPSFR